MIAILSLFIFARVWSSIDIRRPLNTIRILMILYAVLLSCIAIIELIMGVPDTGNVYSYIQRATGPSAVVYIPIMLAQIVLPLSLINKKWGSRKYFILLVAILMNLGYWIETFVVYTTRFHRDYYPSESEAFPFPWPYVSAIIEGVFLALILLGIERLRSFIGKRNHG